MGLGPSTFILGGPGSPNLNFEFCLNNISNAVSIGSIEGPRQGRGWGGNAPARYFWRKEGIASDYQMWKVVVVVVGGGTFRLATGRLFPMSVPWSIVKVNCLMKKLCQYFGNNISNILFVIWLLIWQDFVIVWQNTLRTIWPPFSGLLTALVSLNSVARWCNFACLCIGKIRATP